MQLQARLLLWTVILAPLVVLGLLQSANPQGSQFGTPKEGEGTRIFKATEHPFYSGQFHLSGGKATLVGRMSDVAPWDHLDYAGKRLKSVPGTIGIDVSDLTNTGQVVAEFVEDADRYRIVFDRFEATKPYQDGGIATRVYEHGDSGNGDQLYPKTWLYLSGWGTANLFKNGALLYKDYQAHFMVMERSRDSKTHQVFSPMTRTLPGGGTDPAGMEIDLWVRSQEANNKNFPPFETFVHLYWDEVTWK